MSTLQSLSFLHEVIEQLKNCPYFLILPYLQHQLMKVAIKLKCFWKFEVQFVTQISTLYHTDDIKGHILKILRPSILDDVFPFCLFWSLSMRQNAISSQQGYSVPVLVRNVDL